MSVAVAGALAGLSILGSIGSNKAAGKAFAANTAQVKKSFEKQVAQLKELQESAEVESGLEMTKVRYSALKNSASTANNIVERNVVGNSAARMFNEADVMQMMSHNALAKASEDSIVSFGIEIENKRDAANQAIRNGQAQAVANYTSPLSMATKAAGAFASAGGLESISKMTNAGSTISSGGFDQGMVNGSVGSYTTKSGEFVGV